MGDYATTTKPEEHSNRPNIRDLFPKSSDFPSNNDRENDTDPSVSRL